MNRRDSSVAREQLRQHRKSESFLLKHAYYPHEANAFTGRRLLFAGASMLLISFIGTWGYWYIGGGRWGVLECLYMVLITITTVGYGEVLPISESDSSLVFTIFLLISGLGISFYFLSALTAFIVEGDLTEAMWRRRMGKRVQDLSGHYIVCGAGEVGHNVVVELLEAQKEVVVLDLNPEHLESLNRRVDVDLMGVVGDATEDEVLIACGAERAEGIVSALQNDRDNLFVVVTARQMSPNTRVVSRATNERAAAKMTRAGADAVVCPNTIGGLRMASELLRPTVVGFIDLIVRDGNDNKLTVEELTLPENSPVCNLRLMDSGIRRVGKALILSVLSTDKHQFNPPPEFVLRAGMTLVALGEVDDLNRLKRYLLGLTSLSASSSDSPVVSFENPLKELHQEEGIDPSLEGKKQNTLQDLFGAQESLSRMESGVGVIRAVEEPKQNS